MLYSSEILSFVVAGLGTAVITPLLCKAAHKWNLYAHAGERMSHTGVMPNIGGVGIVLLSMLVYVVMTTCLSFTDWYLVAGVVVMMLTGLWDDHWGLSPKHKLEIETVVAMIVAMHMSPMNVAVGDLLGREIEWPNVSYLIINTLVIVALINAYNLIDGVDGLAAGLGACFLFFFLGEFAPLGTIAPTDSLIAASMIGALVVFFLFNVVGKKWKIFMGDCGSLPIGLVLSYLTLHYIQLQDFMPQDQHQPAIGMVVLLWTIPVFDTIRVMFARIIHGKSPFAADHNHIHHLMLGCGMSHLRVTLTLMFVTMLLTTFMVLNIQFSTEFNWLLIFLAAAVYSGIVFGLKLQQSRKKKQDGKH